MSSRVVIIFIGLLVCQTCADYNEDAWQEPNAWERHSPSAVPPNTCPVCDLPEDGMLAIFYYKKLIANLFNKNELKNAEHTGQLQRSILLTLSPEQLQILENTADIRDLDSVITNILGKITTPKCNTGNHVESKSFFSLIKEICTDILHILQIPLTDSEGRFILFVLGVLLLIWFIHKRYNKSLVVIVTMMFFLFGYFYTYIECNRKLEAEEMLSFVQENEPQEMGWFKKTFSSIFRQSQQDKQIINIQKKTKLKLSFCRPDHVLMMYANDMFLNQLELIIEKCMGMTMSLKNKLTFPYNIIALVCLPILFGFVLKLIFENVLSPVVWYRAMRIGDSIQDQTAQQQQHLPQINLGEDRLSGSNLKLLLETISSNNKTVQLQLPSSGVQEVVESIEAVPNEVLDKSSSDDEFKRNNNVTISDVIEDNATKKDK